MATKMIRSKNDAYEPFEITDTGRKVRFYDFETKRSYTRRAWEDRIHGTHVKVNGAWRLLSQFATTPNGLPFTVCEYVEA